MARLRDSSGRFVSNGNLLKNFRKRGLLARRHRASVTVGFTTRYAIHVHELHKSKSKFLENAARENGKEIGRVVRQTFKQTSNMLTSLLIGGLRLQRESQKRVPVDTGALKGSAFTAPTRNEDAAANAAFKKGEEIRKQAKGKK